MRREVDLGRPAAERRERAIVVGASARTNQGQGRSSDVVERGAPVGRERLHASAHRNARGIVTTSGAEGSRIEGAGELVKARRLLGGTRIGRNEEERREEDTNGNVPIGE